MKGRVEREKSGEGIMGKKWWVGYMAYGLDGHEAWQPIDLTSPTP